MLENNQKELLLLKDLGMLYPNENYIAKRRYGLYKCFCGVEFKTQTQSVKAGLTTSCGCYHKSIMKKSNNINKTTHGLGTHRLYGVWYDMSQRCNNLKNKNYNSYGGRGIKVCDEWQSLEVFISDMFPSYKEGLTLDRIDNNLGYSKDNCRWTTKSVQSRNTRKLYIHNTSGYRGVTFNKSANKWHSQIQVNLKRIYLGLFETSLKAGLAYDKYVIDNNLEHTRNFN